MWLFTACTGNGRRAWSTEALSAACVPWSIYAQEKVSHLQATATNLTLLSSLLANGAA